MTHYYAEQNLALAQKMLQQQGQINALTAALRKLTHEFEPGLTLDRCHLIVSELDDVDLCWWPSDAPIHRTPARVRAEMEGQA